MNHDSCRIVNDLLCKHESSCDLKYYCQYCVTPAIDLETKPDSIDEVDWRLLLNPKEVEQVTLSLTKFPTDIIEKLQIWGIDNLAEEVKWQECSLPNGLFETEIDQLNSVCENLNPFVCIETPQSTPPQSASFHRSTSTKIIRHCTSKPLKVVLSYHSCKPSPFSKTPTSYSHFKYSYFHTHQHPPRTHPSHCGVSKKSPFIQKSVLQPRRSL